MRTFLPLFAATTLLLVASVGALSSPSTGPASAPVEVAGDACDSEPGHCVELAWDEADVIEIEL